MYIYDVEAQRWRHVRETAEYAKRKRMLRDFWIVMGLVMLCVPTGLTIVMALLATFLSFAFLDEAPYRVTSGSYQRQENSGARRQKS